MFICLDCVNRFLFILIGISVFLHFLIFHFYILKTETKHRGQTRHIWTQSPAVKLYVYATWAIEKIKNNFLMEIFSQRDELFSICATLRVGFRQSWEKFPVWQDTIVKVRKKMMMSSRARLSLRHSVSKYVSHLHPTSVRHFLFLFKFPYFPMVKVNVDEEEIFGTKRRKMKKDRNWTKISNYNFIQNQF